MALNSGNYFWDGGSQEEQSLDGELIYSYTVEGQYYSGFHLLAAWSKKKAEALIEGWKGRMVIVRYVRTKHEVSVLLKSDQPGGQLGSRFATPVPGGME